MRKGPGDGARLLRRIDYNAGIAMGALRRIWSSRWTPALLLALVGAGWILLPKIKPRQTFQLEGDMLVSGNPSLHEVCLTFDDGPHPESMNRILDVLKKENVKATFFVVGKVVEQHPELVRRMMAEGHEVGNHTYSHKRLNQMPLGSARQEILACAAAVKRATGASMDLLRPPGMEYNNNVLYLSQELGYVTVHWNVVAADYVPVRPDVVVQRVMDQVKDGSVILLHDSPDTALALETVIRKLKAQKYRFVTTTQMLARLPRPVFIATNAFAVAPETPVAQTVSIPTSEGTRKPKPITGTKGAPVKAALPRGRTTPPIDSPAWDGHSEKSSGQERSEAS
ncbi:MAG: polysaccharide deacetylase family protein [Armatimonadetes bacterium]|nr:polysaccharide deacetylase family protein [Armatimonadota bacterium]